MLELMAHSVLKRILENVHSSPFLAVMVDETTDKSNKEQLTLVVRWISEDFIVSEGFLGLYCLSAINAQEHCGCHEGCLSVVPDFSGKAPWTVLTGCGTM